ncbi:MAG: DUF3306 domain-containing protein [Candidatus Thiosymbion ectosymbiont of Robbea hypermnestra]|nr:DUF3306 domain-containing protein [Candidatus Thiosymbion ectosymbiont of Robbea hypermnestra]
MTMSDDETPVPPASGPDVAEGSGARRSERRPAIPGNAEDDPPPDPAVENRGIAPDARSDAPALTDADMPPIESLDEDSDYSPFLSPKVSQGLRRQALRRLFGLPRFQGSDGLNDYDEDYRRFTALGDVITHEMRRRSAPEPEPEPEGADPAADREGKEPPLDRKENRTSPKTAAMPPDREENKPPPGATTTPPTADPAAPETTDAKDTEA